MKTLTLAWIGLLMACSQTAWGDLAADRARDPILLTGAQTPQLLGSPVGTVVAFRYDGAWTQIPVQIDERAVVDYGVVYNLAPVGLTTLVYTDASTYTGPDPDPALDADDEIVVMAGDAGPLAPAGAAWPAGALPDVALQITVTDAIDGGTAYAYLFLSDGSLDPAAGRDDVTYTFDLLAGSYIPAYNTVTGPNPENSVVQTDHYRVHFSDRWIRDELNVLTGGATGVDILDRHKALFAPGICVRTEDTFSAGEGAFFANVDGPLRAIRSYMGANSGPLTQRDHLYYAQREDVRTFLRVHPIPGVASLLDYSPAATGMTYFNDLNLGGVVVDGFPDVVAPGAIAWELVTGAQGSLAMAFQVITDIPGFGYSSYYSDMLMPIVTQCTGDAFEYGTSGPWINQAIPNTDPLAGSAFTLTFQRTLYYEAPGQTTTTAAARAAQATTPLAATVEPFKTGAIPGDLNGDGVVDTSDLLILLAAWGPCPGPPDPCPADLDGDGMVGVAELLILLANWG